MVASALSVAKGGVTLGAAALAAYAVASVLPAQQVIEPPPENFIAPAVEDTAALAGPRQPVFYRHDVHVGQYKIDCRYCHYTAEIASTPGLPSVAACLGCHLVVQGGSPEIQKLQQAMQNQAPVEWVEVHKLPPYVHFPHSRHVNADPPVTCQTCHGPIQEMVQVYQYASLKMGWCLDCHKERSVTIDCTACHY